MTVTFYPPSARWRIRGFEALCSEGSCEAYFRQGRDPLVFREEFFLFSQPFSRPGVPVTLSEPEKARLRPHWSETLKVSYSLLDDAILLWEDARSILCKLSLAERLGLGTAYVPERFKGALTGPGSPPGSWPSRYTGG